MRGLTHAGDDLERSVFAVLDQRLRRNRRRPLAVALSGGGDSVALLLITADWARRAGRPLLVLTVDHRLQAQSSQWTRWCGQVADRLGAGFQPLAWEGDKPATGLPAAARAARHRLLADAARASGAQVILMGHTEDDGHEARLMRAAGATTPQARQWTPSPAWPQGRDLFLLRPLLAVRRTDLRHWLAARKETWIDDPANDDLRFARARARRAGVRGLIALPDPAPLALASLCQAEPGGALTLPRQPLHTADPHDIRRLVALATVCAGGGDHRPATSRLERVALALAEKGDVVATLAGARIEADEAQVRIQREAGEAARGGLSPLRLAAGETGVWDGRFEVQAARPIEVRSLWGMTGQLPADQQRRLRPLRPGVRAGLPLILGAGTVACPILTPVEGVVVRDLVPDRLAAAAGLVLREPA